MTSFVIIFLFFASCNTIDNIIGVEALTFADEIGGATYYKNSVSQKRATIIVDNKTSLLRALRSAKSGDVIFIDNNAKIDLSGHAGIKINAGVTLASGRGSKYKGALLFSNKLDTSPLLITQGENVRITGLRIQGPDSLRRTSQMKALAKKSKKDYYSIPNSRGIQVMHSNTEVDNCELSAWSHAAVFAQGQIKNIHIHHNFIHHNQRHGLGYGVCLDGASALIEANRFDWNRHAIAGTGKKGTGYTARFNIIGKNANGHAFDMHGGKDRKDGTNLAGSFINIHHNTFYIKKHEAVVIRGVPDKEAIIRNNEFIHLDSTTAVRHTNKTSKIKRFKNKHKPQEKKI